MTPEERAEKIKKIFNKAKGAHDKTKEKANGYFQVIKGAVDRGLDKIESKTAKYNTGYHEGGLMAPPPKLPVAEEAPPAQQAAAKKKRKPQRFEL